MTRLESDSSCAATRLGCVATYNLSLFAHFDPTANIYKLPCSPYHGPGNCNATELDLVTRYRDDTLSALAPILANPMHGGFYTACVQHCHSNIDACFTSEMVQVRHCGCKMVIYVGKTPLALPSVRHECRGRIWSRLYGRGINTLPQANRHPMASRRSSSTGQASQTQLARRVAHRMSSLTKTMITGRASEM